MPRWSIRNKLLVCIALLVAVVATLAYGAFSGAYAYRTLTKTISSRAAELPLASEMAQHVSDLRETLSHTRRLREIRALTGETPVDSQSLRAQFSISFDLLKQSLLKYRTQLEISEQAGHEIGDLALERQTVSRMEESLQRIDRLNDDEDWMLDQINVEQLTDELRQLHALTSELPTHLQSRMESLATEVRGKYRAWIVLTWLCGTFSVLMLILMFLLVYRWVFRPLRVLLHGSRIVANGQFSHRIHLETRDEIAELADAMNNMTARFQEIKADLDQQVRERTMEAVRSEQLASVGVLAAGVAHEINNPLASIAFRAEALTDRLADVLVPGEEASDYEKEELTIVRNYLQTIIEEAFRCKGITERLLDFSREGTHEREATDLVGLVQGVIEMVRHLGKYREKEIVFQCEQAVSAQIVPQEIKQVVLNLITNGLEALGSGGTLTLKLAQRGGEVELCVSDDGCGMTPEVLAHIFEPFFTSRQDGSGNGLGLAITHRIIKDHGGRIVATSDGPGRGSQFRVTLPVKSHEKNSPDNIKPHERLKILFADDEKALQEIMRLELPRMGHEVTVCPDGFTAIAALEKNTYDCILVDLDMPGMNGIQVIAHCKGQTPDTEAVVLTGKSSLDTAIAALRHGAFDYLTKPCRLVELQSLLKRIADKRELLSKYRALKRQVEQMTGGKTDLIGNSGPMQKVRTLISKVAPTNSTVLILGETGTGKELVARSLHEQSLRADMPFVAVNCGALPETLIESELFGHRKGAFTGADDHRTGLFEVANGGTIFLDEIGELPKAMQAKLLRVLESGEIRPVGDNDAKTVDVRVVCATHRNLEEMSASGDFREDLMFRINTFEIALPSLRERLEDIPRLASHLYCRFNKACKPEDELFSPEAIEALQSHTWPGNVRELANVIEHATILCDKPPILPEHLPRRFDSRKLIGAAASSSPSGGGRGFGPITLRDLEMQAIYEALDRHEGNKPKAADELGISLKTLYNKLNQSTPLAKSA